MKTQQVREQESPGLFFPLDFQGVVEFMIPRLWLLALGVAERALARDVLQALGLVGLHTILAVAGLARIGSRIAARVAQSTVAVRAAVICRERVLSAGFSRQKL